MSFRPAVVSNYGLGLPWPFMGRYLQFTILNASTEFAAMDGNMVVKFDYLGTGTAVFVNICGWRSAGGSIKEMWTSPTGVTWTRQTDFPGAARHRTGCEVMGGAIYVYGGDGLVGDVRDVWKYTFATGWVQLTTDWGNEIGTRVLYNTWNDGSALYLSGGQSDLGDTPTMYTDTFRSVDGITWVKIGDLPIGLAYFSAGAVFVKSASEIYFAGGGRYKNSGHDNFNTKVYKSLDGGISFVEHSTLPAEMRTIYCNGGYFQNRGIFLNGFNLSNQTGIWFTTDFTTWTKFYTNPTGRHAAGFWVDDSIVLIVAGNSWNDSYSIKLNNFNQTL